MVGKRRRKSIEGDGDAEAQELEKETPKHKKTKTSKKRASTPPKELETHAHRTHGRSVSVDDERRYSGILETLRLISAEESAKKKRRRPSELGQGVRESRSRSVSVGMKRGNLNEDENMIDAADATMPKIPSRGNDSAKVPAIERGHGMLSVPPAGDTKEHKEVKHIIRRPRKPQPWNVSKHVVMARDLLRDARSVNLHMRLRKMIRKNLDAQKETKIAFKEVATSIGYIWHPMEERDAATRDEVCEDILELANRSSLESDARKTLLAALKAYRNAQLKIDSTFLKATPHTPPVQPAIDDILSQTASIKAHVNLSQETLKNSVQQGRPIKVKHIDKGFWELHSTEYAKAWASARNAPEWQVPMMLLRRNDCQLENGQRVHKCHVAGILIGEEEFETHCLQIPKHASLDPIVAPTQEGRYVEGEEDTCNIEIMFFGHGCIKLRIPRRLIKQPLRGKASGKKREAMVDFYGVQVLQSKVQDD